MTTTPAIAPVDLDVARALVEAQAEVDAAAAAVKRARAARLDAVADARAAGWSLGRIAGALGISRGAAQELARDAATR